MIVPSPVLPPPNPSAMSEEETLTAEPGALPDEIVVELVQRAQRLRSNPRRTAQSQRERILRSRHRLDIEHYVRSIYSKEFSPLVCAHITATANPFADVVSGVLQLYRGGAVRRVQGATEDEQEAFHKLVVESGIEAHAQGWAEMGYGAGPQFVTPTIRRQRLRLLAPLPSNTDAVLDAQDPTGPAVAMSYQVGKAARGGVSVAIVDGETTRVFDPVGGSAVAERTEMRVEHGLGDLPASSLRFWEADADDWWGYDRHQRLVDGALTVGHLSAKLRLVRKAQDGKLLTVVGNTDGMAKGQMIGNPTGPIFAREDGEAVDEARRTEISALDFDTDPITALRHIRAEVEWMAESTGVPVQVETDGTSKWDYSWDHEALAELRKALLWWAVVWERQLWFAAVSIAKRMQHPLASRLPDPKRVLESFTLSLPPLHRKFSDPLAEQQWWEWMLKHGQASILDLSRRFHGQLSDKAHSDQIMEKMAINTAFWDMVASRNRPLDLDGDTPPAQVTESGEIQTAAQAQGALGPAVRDGRVPQPDGRG